MKVSGGTKHDDVIDKVGLDGHKNPMISWFWNWFGLIWLRYDYDSDAHNGEYVLDVIEKVWTDGHKNPQEDRDNIDLVHDHYGNHKWLWWRRWWI